MNTIEFKGQNSQNIYVELLTRERLEYYSIYFSSGYSQLPVQFTLVSEPVFVYPILQMHLIEPVVSSREQIELILQPPLSMRHVSRKE